MSGATAAGFKLGQVRKAKRSKGKKRRVLVVKSNPAAEAQPTGGKVNLKLRPKSRKSATLVAEWPGAWSASAMSGFLGRWGDNGATCPHGNPGSESPLPEIDAPPPPSLRNRVVRISA